MQVHLDIEDGRKAGRCFTHVGKSGRLVDRERVGASKLDEEQIVLNEVVTKRRFGERAVCQSVREGSPGVTPPLGGCCCLETLEETHDLVCPACLSVNVLGSLPITHCRPRSYGDRAQNRALSGDVEGQLPLSRGLCTVTVIHRVQACFSPLRLL